MGESLSFPLINRACSHTDYFSILESSENQLKVEHMKETSTSKFPAPPAHFSERTRKLWTALGPDNAKSEQRRQLFQTALESLDRADAAREQIEIHGMVMANPTTGAPHVHPLLRVERESRQLFARIWTQMKLDKGSADHKRLT